MSSVALIIFLSFVEQARGETFPKLPKLPKYSKDKGATTQDKKYVAIPRTYPLPEEQLIQMEQLNKEARDIVFRAKQSVEKMAKAREVAQTTQSQIATASPEQAPMAVSMCADAVSATADWVAETIFRSDSMNEVAERSLQIAPRVESDMSVEMKREYAMRVDRSWTRQNARDWGSMIMRETTKMKSEESTETAGWKLGQLVTAVTAAEKRALDVFWLAEETAVAIERSTRAVKEKVAKLDKKSGKVAKNQRVLPVPMDEDALARAQEAAERAEAALLADEEAEKAERAVAAAAALEAKLEEAPLKPSKLRPKKVFAQRAPEVAVQSAKGAQIASATIRTENANLRIPQMFARTTGSNAAILVTAILGLFAGSTTAFAVLRFRNVVG
eukprot:gnl/MRDRNA2_/MRDRNA2_113409_c0_seq1.p1 gnl/MRDRNA2_/MRDRNA2_113409_c0~~gnl/MRDRNA2_/MRDRNA2_113409_c0_seq1.p1  ORF type:complete len:387 (+),score=95.23 gnl/MRDRNA2_/MRDRNA2_113409_c0_seq1:123-1283(+)